VDAPGTRQPWWGKLVGVIAGFLLLRAEPVLGALIGLLLGHAVDAGWFRGRREDPYRVLGLTEDADDAQVELARRRLLAKFHPDRATDAAAREDAERQARAINAAYDRIRALRQSDR
jgi:preprotein translocase subunit Sec63